MPQKCPLKVNRPKPRLYNRRLIRSGNVLELYEYGKPVMRGAVVHGSAFYGRANAPYTSAETKRENRAKIARRARETVRRTINANPQLDKFFTLTYAENLQDVPQARKEFDVHQAPEKITPAFAIRLRHRVPEARRNSLPLALQSPLRRTEHFAVSMGTWHRSYPAS